MRSLWFENLVVEAMAKEAGCLLKASMSGDFGASKRKSFTKLSLTCKCASAHARLRAEDAIGFFKSRGMRLSLRLCVCAWHPQPNVAACALFAASCVEFLF